MRRYIPLISGILMPLSTFLNLQSLTVPGWSYEYRGNSSTPYGNNPACHPHSSPALKFEMIPSLNSPEDDRAKFIFIFSIISLLFGVLGTCALFVRMLERKIKWMTRLIIFGAWAQSFFGIVALFCFVYPASVSRILSMPLAESVSEGIFFNVCAVFSSFFVAASFTYHHITNQFAVYSYTLYDLSLSQRQLIILTISSLFYMSAVSGIYGWIEGWDFDNAIYWSIATFTTIGFGDFAPITALGRALIPIVTFIGIGLVGGNIWSLRNVLLELVTLQLAHQYSKRFGIAKEEDKQLLAEHAMESGIIPGARIDPAAHHSRLHSSSSRSNDVTSLGETPAIFALDRNRSASPEHHSNQTWRNTHRHMHHSNTHSHALHSGSNASRGQLSSSSKLTTGHIHGRHRRAHSFDETRPDRTWLTESLASGALRSSSKTSSVKKKSTPTRLKQSKENGEAEERRPLLESTDDSDEHTQVKMEHRFIEDDTYLPSTGMLASHQAGERFYRDIEALQVEQLDREPREVVMKNPAYARTFTISEYDLGSATHRQTASSVSVNHPLRDRFVPPPHDYRRELTISRSRFLPDVTIIADSTLRKRQIVETTQQTLQFQLAVSILLVLITMIAFGGVFAWLEQWSFWEGIYFAYCSAATIGYGDLSLCSFAGRSIFVWFIFFAILSWTYLGSMVAEIALDQWTVTVDHIEKRVDRYERKAKLKKLYGKRSKYAADNKGKKNAHSVKVPPTTRHTDPIKPTNRYENKELSFLDLDEQDKKRSRYSKETPQHSMLEFNRDHDQDNEVSSSTSSSSELISDKDESSELIPARSSNDNKTRNISLPNQNTLTEETKSFNKRRSKQTKTNVQFQTDDIPSRMDLIGEPSTSFLRRRSTHALLSGRLRSESFHPRHSRSFSSFGSDEISSRTSGSRDMAGYGTMRSISHQHRAVDLQPSTSLPVAYIPAEASDHEDASSVIRIRLPSERGILPNIFLSRHSDEQPSARRSANERTLTRLKQELSQDSSFPPRTRVLPSLARIVSSRGVPGTNDNNVNENENRGVQELPASATYPVMTRSPEDIEMGKDQLERLPLLSMSCPNPPSPMNRPSESSQHSRLPSSQYFHLDMDEIHSD